MSAFCASRCARAPAAAATALSYTCFGMALSGHERPVALDIELRPRHLGLGLRHVALCVLERGEVRAGVDGKEQRAGTDVLSIFEVHLLQIR